jgi:hypothetical protein
VPTPAKEQQPEQMPGDAESPPKGTVDPAVQEAMGHTDKTEPVQSAQNKSPGKPK